MKSEKPFSTYVVTFFSVFLHKFLKNFLHLDIRFIYSAFYTWILIFSLKAKFNAFNDSYFSLSVMSELVPNLRMFGSDAMLADYCLAKANLYEFAESYSSLIFS